LERAEGASTGAGPVVVDWIRMARGKTP
jgi:hypothetical protein